ncbi:protein FAR1-RELATED SEQUENCE 5-like [Daucus carota subsp. sativus]|uniref:protein FAR1-RELATED SEQUENCE 5-like n=1 Tax=Daucus carota subsp. sativus TaxID=79200 RepID=UPI003082DDF7
MFNITGSICGDSSRISSSTASCDPACSDYDDSISSYVLSPGGRRYYSPSVGGFDVWKGTEKGADDGTITLKHFVCSCEGFVEPNIGRTNGIECRERRTVSKRCGCKARLVMKYMFPNKYFVMSLIDVHNHPLASETGWQFLRASREMTVGLRNVVYDAAKANIGCSKTYTLVKEMVGGYSNVGATLCDFRNFNRDLKSYVGDKDGQMIIDKFKVISETSEGFYYAYKVDSAGHLIKLFWADAIGRRNFELYGDAMSFDATFDTNKYNMIFAPFTGVDKHDKCVTFACCLLSQKNVAHYTWAFDHLVKAMGRNPVVVITDQCPTMKIAVPTSSFSSANGLIASKHRLCMWHIMEKFPVKLGNRLVKETDFMEKMKKYIWSSSIEIEEFERGWEAVVKEFKLEDNKWLKDMYGIRASWIPAFFRDQPMFGLLRTTSRSESKNSFFGQFHKQGDSLCEFWLRYQSAMDRQRNETNRLNHESNSSLPSAVSRWFIENDAADLFTLAIFYKVQEEIIASCLDMQIKRMSEERYGVLGRINSLYKMI